MHSERSEDLPLAELVAARRRELNRSLAETARLMRGAAANEGDRQCVVTRQAIHEYENGRIPHPRGQRYLAVALDLPTEEVAEAARRQRMNRRQAMRSVAALGGVLLNEPLAYALEDRGRLDASTVTDMAAVTAAYRRAYRYLSVRTLRTQVNGQRTILGELLRCSASPTLRDQLVTTLGETEALLACMLLLDLGDFGRASFHLARGLDAARQTDAQELEAFILGGMTFYACYAGNQQEALRLIERARQLASTAGTTVTRGWLAAVAAEVNARAGDVTGALHALDDAATTLQHFDANNPPPWIGIGTFNEAKLTSYAGLCYVLLGQPRRAVDELTGALHTLDPALRKHRCTAMADLATALIQLREVEEGCRQASESLGLAIELRHAANAERIRRLRPQLAPWSGHPAVKRLDEQLQLVSRW
jgi:tetratricopeptide (TPR) repeat protein